MDKRKLYIVIAVFLIILGGAYFFYLKSDSLFLKILSFTAKEMDNISINNGQDHLNVLDKNQIQNEEKEKKPETVKITANSREGKNDIIENKDIINQKTENKAIKIDNSDKNRIMQLILKKLSREDISFLLSLLKDGLTEEEKEKAKFIAYNKFSAEEIEEIKKLYYKYKHLLK